MLRKIVSGGLILFVCFSIGYLIYSEMAPQETQNIKNPPHSSQQSTSNLTNAPTNPQNLGEKVIVYYFHGTYRCPTCRAIEEYTLQAVKEKFSKELDEGKVEFKTINLEEPENQHFIEDFKLVTRCVVIEKVVNNKSKEHTKLEKVWDYVHGEKEDFFKYIQDNIQKYLS